MTTPAKHTSRIMAGLAMAAALAWAGLWMDSSSAQAAEAAKVAASSPRQLALAQYHKEIEPLLDKNCFDCHTGAEARAGVAFDKLTTDDDILKNPELWLKVLKNTRAGIMPADGHPRLTAAEQAKLDNWIKFSAFGIDPQNFDPGRVTVHRLNRFEYRNTIHDLLGVDFNTNLAFPGDDIGYGFDNIADVLNVSPLLMEKYLAAAQTIVGQAVPSSPRVAPTIVVYGRDFKDADTGGTPTLDSNTIDVGDDVDEGYASRSATRTSYFNPAHYTRTFSIKDEGDYKVWVEEGIGSNFNYVAANCTVVVSVDGKPSTNRVVEWHGANSNTEKQPSFYDSVPVHWTPGDHEISVSVEPLSGVRNGTNDAFFLMRSVTIQGPSDQSKWVHPANYSRFFTRDEAPADAAGRRVYAREILGAFATKAFRRPAPAESVDNLVALAEAEYSKPGKTFEQGIGQAMVAVLASPRFLFRIDQPEVVPGRPPGAYARVDEYSLASRLSYFLWSTMPDEELLKLAAAGQLRQNLAAQVKRMAADPRADAFAKNFSGQWLQSRAIKTVSINAREIFSREDFDSPANYDLTIDQRSALNKEAQAYFSYVMRSDRSMSEFLESNYIFLNSTLANFYYRYNADGYAANFQGNDMRKVELNPGDWRGGILTLGSVLMVTSNPTRTSPVKRGKWILENILDAPAPPPPPNIPSLDEAGKDIADHTPSQREILALHRADPNCSSCHDRMDPLGLAMENFSGMASWRTTDMGQPIDATGKLVTGESFKDVRDLKHILATQHLDEFYFCLTQKMLTYALGRGPEYYDVPTIDKIVENIKKNDGRFSAMLMGIVDSAAFQEERLQPSPDAAKTVASLTPNPSAP